MREDDFALWLEQHYRTRKGTHLEPRPRRDAKSRCKRVERHEGDLDAQFVRDGMQGLLETLTHTRADEMSGVSPKHHVQIDGDAVNGTASLRNAVALYRSFCRDVPPANRR